MFKRPDPCIAPFSIKDAIYCSYYLCLVHASTQFNSYKCTTLSINQTKTNPVKGKENLKQRAYLNSLTSVLDYVGAQLTGFIVSPFIVSGLGSSLYGSWQMLGQMTGYAGMADIRASQVLKWTIANKRDTATMEELRSEVTSAFAVTFLILPIVLVLGGVIIWYAPHITKARPEHYDLIRIACSLLVLSLVINKLFDVFESVLRGMNLGFKRMGFRAGIVAVAGALKVLAITQGFGIVGLSIIEVIISLFMGCTFYYIVKQNIGWFGFGSTNFSKVLSYGKLSGWFMAFNGSRMLLLNSDKILLGYLAGPSFVTKYAITMFASHALYGFIYAVINGVIPGIGNLFGKKEFGKVRKGRRIIITLNWLLCATLGSTILILNKSFISLWIGEEHFAGSIENLLILLVSLQTIFFQIDSLIITVTLNLKMKLLYASTASIITLIMAFILVDNYLIIGLCMSVLLGRFVLTVGYPLILRNRMQDKSPFLNRHILQPLLIIILLFATATYWGERLFIDSWVTLFAAGFILIIGTGLFFWFAGITQQNRKDTWEVISKIKLLGSNPEN